jgi:pimeloyl-ACP methyl ester carboxylesterase
MRRSLSACIAGVVAICALAAFSGAALAIGLDPAFSEPALGPQQAKGIVIWSHGRSTNSEDSESPTPAYLSALRDDGWDVMRFNRLSHGDTLADSSKRLVDYVDSLKQKGYRRVVVAGQSFGAFLSLMAADATAEIDAVIATAPAAYGSFDDFYDSWRLNATRLYPLLEQIRHARVMVFYFHADDFDPGGRGERTRAILSGRGVGYAVIDQPSYLTGHWASSTGLFLRRFGNCIRDFADSDHLSGELQCNPRWGTWPSAELNLPSELTHPMQAYDTAAQAEPAGGSAGAFDVSKMPEGARDAWYGVYPNGREVVLAIGATQGDNVEAVYAIGPSIDNKNAAVWSRRSGHVADEGYLFEESGKSALRFRRRPDGGLAATWVSADGKSSMMAHLRHVDPNIFVQHEEPKGSAPVTTAAAHGNGEEPQE